MGGPSRRWCRWQTDPSEQVDQMISKEEQCENNPSQTDNIEALKYGGKIRFVYGLLYGE